MAQSKTAKAIDDTFVKIEAALCADDSTVCKCCGEIRAHFATLKQLVAKAVGGYKKSVSKNRKK